MFYVCGDNAADALLLHSYDADRDKFLGVEDLKKMMKKIKSSPIEPSGMEDMIKEVDEDGDGKLSLREVHIMFTPHYLTKRDSTTCIGVGRITSVGCTYRHGDILCFGLLNRMDLRGGHPLPETV